MNIFVGTLNGIVLTIKIDAITMIATKNFRLKKSIPKFFSIALHTKIYEQIIPAAFGIGIPTKSDFSLEEIVSILNLANLITPQIA